LIITAEIPSKQVSNNNNCSLNNASASN